jgi:osmotically-inducible protein OsmY/predicted RNA-binding Zn-ribbon protein involved in translation (DUF1610 family)
MTFSRRIQVQYFGPDRIWDSLRWPAEKIRPLLNIPFSFSSIAKSAVVVEGGRDIKGREYIHCMLLGKLPGEFETFGDAMIGTIYIFDDGTVAESIEKEKLPEEPVGPKVEMATGVEAEEIKTKAEKPEDAIICPKCGTPYPLTAKFCKKDGTPLQPQVEIKKPEVKEKEIKPEETVEPKLETPIEVKTEEKPPEPETVIEPKVSAEEKPAEKILGLEKPKDVIICPKCGTPNLLTAKFCKKDGNPLKEETKPSFAVEKEIKPEVAVSPAVKVAPKVEVKKEEAKRPSKTWIWVAVCGLVLIIAGVGSYLYFSGQIGKKPTEVTAVPEVPRPPEPPKAPEEVEKPTIPQEPETEIVSPPAPAEPAKPSVDVARIERDLNRTLRNRGLGDVYAEVNEDLIATLKGTVDDPRDKMLALNITESFKEIKSVKNEIRVEAPAYPAPISKIDPAKFEGDINRALRNAGLRGVTAEVNDNLEVTLKGSVTSQYEKNRAFEIAKRFKEAKRIRDVIFVVEQ